MDLPSLAKLTEFEKRARVEGSGIEFDSLLGIWKFNTLWKQGSDKEDSISSTLLQVFSASLELKKDTQNQEEDDKFSIANSIQFGLLTLRFSGSANLERKQPLLPFSFDCIEIKIASLTILKRSLPTPDLKKRPFFALIAIDSNGQWLSARGKGGGLALWVQDK
tara:strand:- start:160 stop:651 length:492 start_codon:yes stop_codon:yes gene_type:complete